MVTLYLWLFSCSLHWYTRVLLVFHSFSSSLKVCTGTTLLWEGRGWHWSVHTRRNVLLLICAHEPVLAHFLLTEVISAASECFCSQSVWVALTPDCEDGQEEWSWNTVCPCFPWVTVNLFYSIWEIIQALLEISVHQLVEISWYQLWASQSCLPEDCCAFHPSVAGEQVMAAHDPVFFVHAVHICVTLRIM